MDIDPEKFTFCAVSCQCRSPIALHYTTLHYITLHYITLYTLHYTILRSNTLHYTTLHYITLHHITVHYTTLHYIALHYMTLHYVTLHYITLHYITLHYTTLHYITLHYITLHYITLYCIATHTYTPTCACACLRAMYGPFWICASHWSRRHFFTHAAASRSSRRSKRDFFPPRETRTEGRWCDDLYIISNGDALWYHIYIINGEMGMFCSMVLYGTVCLGLFQLPTFGPWSTKRTNSSHLIKPSYPSFPEGHSCECSTVASNSPQPLQLSQDTLKLHGRIAEPESTISLSKKQCPG